MKRLLLFTILVLPFVLAGCSGAKKQLGLSKHAPDEFAVIRRAPLSMPPDYTLRPPIPGADRPQEQSTEEAAKTALFGTPEKIIVRDGLSESENILLDQAGAHIADSQIREKIRAEEDVVVKDTRPIGQRIFGIGSPDADEAINAKEEFKRIRGQNDDATDEK